jgi:hypothetical protein
MDANTTSRQAARVMQMEHSVCSQVVAVQTEFRMQQQH